jgi:CIC family chloride channel protein
MFPHGHRHAFVAATRRTRQVLLISGVTGAGVGLGVAAFEWITADVLLEAVRESPVAVQAALPAVGLLMAAVCLHLGRRPPVSPATADEYIASFHSPAIDRPSLRDLPRKMGAAIATLGAGAPLGYEGPSVYLGSTLGNSLQNRLRRSFRAEERKVLLVAGAAAGVAAIFKAPVTGLVFALEVPYQEDLARRMLLPAIISAASSYVVFAAVAGTEPLLPVAGQPPFDLRDLGGAAVVGLVAGTLARLFILLIQSAKQLSGQGHPAVRALIGGASIGVCFLLGHALTGDSLVTGPGYDTLRWALDPDIGLWLVVAVATLRVAATVGTVGAGGVGGLFIPLVIQGALVGRTIGGVVDPSNPTLLPVVGMAAFLGAGYRVPLAAVVFVAEFTGRPGFVVPGLIAAAVGQLAVGRRSVSPYQAPSRTGHLERRLALPLRAVVDTEARTVPSDATVEELFWQHLVADRQHSALVVDDSTYRGIAGTPETAGLPREQWGSTTVGEVMRTDVPPVPIDGTVEMALDLLNGAGSDRIAVCDGDRYVGSLTTADIVRLDEVLSRGGAEEDGA